MKKASANMWWIIIGAVIALVVMIVLLILFTQKTAGLESGLTDCEGKGGVCVAEGDCPVSTASSSAFSCTTGKCCIGLPKTCTKNTIAQDCGNADDFDCKTVGSKEYCFAK